MFLNAVAAELEWLSVLTIWNHLPHGCHPASHVKKQLVLI
jgi:hypothetical protein